MLVFALVVLMAFPAAAQDGPSEPITAANAHLLEAGYGLPPGGCRGDSPDGSLLLAGNSAGSGAVYDVARGEARFAVQGVDGVFSSDGMLLAVDGDGLYDTATGERRFAIVGTQEYQQAAFSPDESLLVVPFTGVYDVASGDLRFPMDNYGTFSPDGRLLAVAEDGVYDLRTGQRRFAIGGRGRFSPDGSLLYVTVRDAPDALYDVASGARLRTFRAEGGAFSLDGMWLAAYEDGLYARDTLELRLALDGAAVFNAESSLLAAEGDGLYTLPEATRRFTIGGAEYGLWDARFSPDGQALAVHGDGVYALDTGEKRFAIPALGAFSADGSLFAASFDALYAVTTGDRFLTGLPPGSAFEFSADGSLLYVTVPPGAHCLVYGLAGRAWPYRDGLAFVSEPGPQGWPALYDRPGGAAGEAVFGSLRVLARSADGAWLEVETVNGAMGWVQAGAVTIIALPEGMARDE